jgi:putative membrane-bound dehydrogenase-like protein
MPYRQFAIRLLAITALLAALAVVYVAPAQVQSGAVSKAPIDEPLPPHEAAKTMRVPEGFKVSLFAGEPAVKQPIGFCIDDRSRLWVAEAYNYPNHGTKAGDRIVILEDRDGDGAFDERKVFYDKLNYVTGVEFGFGGAWVMSPPYFYFIPDRNGDDQPDGPPEVLLDGFGNHANAHNLANGFAWGPDGWLYGTHGRTNWSLIGKPGTPEKDRVRFDGGVYRYHPTRRVWEPYCDGTTNPWGIDWNDYGEAFITNCVNPHLFHAVYGAHYEPWRNRESSQYAYQRIDTIADHLHFVGGANVRDGLGSHAEDEAGGGHAHCGTMVYLGDNWPEQYRNTLFTNNIHGRRINNDLLQRAGSGYKASHGKDLLRSQDSWFMGVTLKYGPDGGVYVIDWSDTGECHSVRNTQRETGRIYKITFGDLRFAPIDFAKLTTEELVAKQLHRNDWHVRQARRLLQERSAAGADMAAASAELRKQFDSQEEIPCKLRALWALYTIGAADESFLAAQLRHPSEYLRAWAVRLLCESGKLAPAIHDQLLERAKEDSAPLVRMHLASCLQRLPLADRWQLAEALLAHQGDAEDQNIPLLLWYAVEPLVTNDRERFVSLAKKAAIPLVANHIARRATALPNSADTLSAVTSLLETSSGEIQAEILRGTLIGLQGRRTVPMPKDWPAAYAKLRSNPDAAVAEQALALALIFDDPEALLALRKEAADPQSNPTARNRAIQALVTKRVTGFDTTLLSLLTDSTVTRAALRGLAEFDHPQTAEHILARFDKLDPAARQDALQTLAARPAWGLKLVAALETKQIPRSDVTAYTARQLFSLNHADLTARLQKAWGELRVTPAEKQQLIATFKKRFTPESIQQADRSAGRAIFQKTCANCHRIFGEGGQIGPDITGSQRTNLDYLLQTLIDPSAAVNKDYQMQLLQLIDGRVITGLVLSETPAALTIQTVTEKIVVPTAEIEQRKLSPVSMMPDGLLQNLSPEQVRQLLSYLMGPAQVPLPKTD